MDILLTHSQDARHHSLVLLPSFLVGGAVNAGQTGLCVLPSTSAPQAVHMQAPPCSDGGQESREKRRVRPGEKKTQFSILN